MREVVKGKNADPSHGWRHRFKTVGIWIKGAGLLDWGVRKPVLVLVSILFCSALAFAAKYLDEGGMLEWDPIEDRIGSDQRTVWLATRADRQRSDIALVTIGEDSLRDYPFISPISRTLLAALVCEIDAVAPKALGLDVIIEPPSPGDDDLIRAISIAKHPIVLGGIDDRYARSNPDEAALTQEGILFQENFARASGVSIGHIWLEHKTGFFHKDDETVRYVAASNVGHPSRESFSYVLAKAAGYDHRPISRIIAWLRPPQDQTTPLFPQLTVPRHKPDDLARGRKLFSSAELELLKGRIVLVGATMSDRDRHKTPLSVRDGRRAPGVAIHAQVVAQIIDERDITETTNWAKLLLYFLTSAACLALSTFYKIHAHHEIGAVAVALFGLALFWGFSIDIPVGPLIFVGMVSVFVVPCMKFIKARYVELSELLRRWNSWGAEGR
ncbi:CHASE2 domain-containing protein [Bradyrhizobium yuanmingense]|uniref:CHASE2 domain-containing protein n=1 Tax=Bradyrhizobium yuanmingense TaxID=108015 RepID=UPI0023B8FC66|nr:CHASE2 domain-containing protein [Bradyrhizobium yuanmingense]MDF0497338.1 CHASE2 domain-containing protein [Bradyrhizobium yuanmingense]